MTSFLDKLQFPVLQKKGDSVEFSDYNEGLIDSIKLISVKDLPSDFDCSETEVNAIKWTKSIDSYDFYMDLAHSVARTNSIYLPGFGLKGNHSLSINDTTWLILNHDLFGTCAILQRNFSFEAAFFSDLGLMVLRHEGRLQLQFLSLLIRTIAKDIDKTRLYLNSPATFGGINFIFPSPFHAINFGHSALFSIQNSSIRLRATAYVNPDNVWFDPCNIFPEAVTNLRPFVDKAKIVELQQPESVFLIKPAHKYLAKELSLNRNLDMVLLASSRCQPVIDIPKTECRLWIGLTSGRRSLLNEGEIIEQLVKELLHIWNLTEVVIDGWTSSSMKNYITNPPRVYESHDSEFLRIKNRMHQIAPLLKVKSLIGNNYEQKVREANNCSFFFSNALTASLVPGRICSLPGIIHSSNKARGSLQMHIYRKATMIPQELIDDDSNCETSDVYATPYRISPTLFEPWLKNCLADHGLACASRSHSGS